MYHIPPPLREYQSRAVGDVLSTAEPTCLVAPTGSGKSRMGAEIAARLPGRGAWIVHRRELLRQARDLLARHGLDDRVTPVTVQSAEWPVADFVVVDECIAEGQTVGGRPVESIEVGDRIPSLSGVATVIAKSCRPFDGDLIRITTECGASLLCTPNHPILVGEAVVRADEVEVGDFAWRNTSGEYRPVQLPGLWAAVRRYSEAATGTRQQGRQARQASGLVPSVSQGAISSDFFRDDGAHQQEARIGAHEEPQPDAARRSAGQVVAVAQGHGPQAAQEGRQWQADAATAVDAAWCPRGAMESGTFRPNRHETHDRLSTVLQDRRCTPGGEDSGRGGWQVAQHAGAQGARPEEGCTIARARVARVARVERIRAGELGVRRVFNLETTDGTFESGGILTHNCHHYQSDEWSNLFTHYANARTIGLTATPERADGRALGDRFSRLVVAANYSDLLRDGFLVDCRVLRPDEVLSKGLALDPVDAYLKHGEQRAGFVFVQRVSQAKEIAERFRAVGIEARAVTERCSTAERDAAIDGLASGEVRLLVNVYTLTEGVDIPHASVCILARPVGHVSQYLQIAGRILRPCDGKQDALLIDLTGASHLHGLPTEDRLYSLDGVGIRRKSQSVTTCQLCGASYESGTSACPECGFVLPHKDWKPPRVMSVELRDAYLGAATREDVKLREYFRLRATQRRSGHSVESVVVQFHNLFGCAPSLDDVSRDERRAEYQRLAAIAEARGYKVGFAAARYHAIFGEWPNSYVRRWRAAS